MRIALTLGAACATALLTATTAATTATATAATPAGHDRGVIWGTVVSGPDLKVRDRPGTDGRIVAKLPHGSQDRVECAVKGTTAVHGNTDWYWLTGVRGWVSAAYVDTHGRHVPSCSAVDPCPQWRDKDCHHDPCAYRDR
ncbi:MULTISPECIES: SH3 domain-containing protein [Streptomyces]|uniref:SH3 domain-containing protein n=1 Tax=Streptomyces TaxID=1883 RepID=UPI001E642C6A|nr:MULTISPECIES: SH3 domain-containing protein [Streptomyces]UFQ16989.1 SH3 domain-containing protein [Streptomyces huasconensis]WCL86591.1 SH3 domain-containing protein [Streptomyces sp. JCM 35825]